ncbi:MAG: acyl-CoA thioesterase [Planctomycetota bacterium]|jgi:acyl-CoA thioester hydrolase
MPAATLKPRPGGLDLTPFDVPHAAPFLCDVVVGSGSQPNPIDHVSNLEFVRWLDRSAQLHADSLGYTRRWLVDNGIMWFVARHEIDYLAEARPGDGLVLATWVRDMHRVRSWRDYVVVRPDDRTAVCRAATLWVLVDLASRRPTRIPAAMARKFHPLHAARRPQPRHAAPPGVAPAGPCT